MTPANDPENTTIGLDQLLQQVRRFSTPHRHDGPRGRRPGQDPAAWALGQALAVAWSQNPRDDVLSHFLPDSGATTLPPPPTGIAQAFWAALARKPLLQATRYQVVAHWLLQVDAALAAASKTTSGTSSEEALEVCHDALLHCYACHLVAMVVLRHHQSPSSSSVPGQGDGKKLVQDHILEVAGQLHAPGARTRLMEAALQTVAAVPSHDYASGMRRHIITPLAALCMLHRGRPMAEYWHVKDALIAFVWQCLEDARQQRPSRDAWEWIVWHTRCLHFHLWGLYNFHDNHRRKESSALTASWLGDLIGLALEFVGDTGLEQPVLDWMLFILETLVPHIFALSMSPPAALHRVLQSMDTMLRLISVPLSPTAGQRLCVLALSAPPRMTNSVLKVISLTSVQSAAAQSVVESLTTIVTTRDDTVATATAFEFKPRRGDAREGPTGQESLGGFHWMQQYAVYCDKTPFLSDLLLKHDFVSSSLSESQQLTAMLFGMSFLPDRSLHDCVLNYLSLLCRAYPHLSPIMLPVFLQRLRDAILEGDGELVTKYLRFMSASLVLDPTGAGQFWSILMDMMDEHAPLTVKITVIRLLPTLCMGNSRLCRRSLELLGAHVQAPQPEMRLAVSATIADLTKVDIIRDLGNVIAWVQKLLGDDLHGSNGWNDLVAHHALLSLHHMTKADELEFDIVVRVLSKRLCAIEDVEALMKLPLLVLEALVLLLGDGQASTTESGSDDELLPVLAAVSPQVEQAVAAVLHIGLCLASNEAISLVNGGNKDQEVTGKTRVMSNVLAAVAKYQLSTLGCDEDSAQYLAGKSNANMEDVVLPSSFEKYQRLRQLLLDSLDGYAPTSDSDHSWVQIASKIVAFEETSFGSALWLKHGRKASSIQGSIRSRPILNALPKAKTLQDRVAKQKLSPGKAIALLFCSDGKSLSTLRDYSDACIEGSEPILLALAVQAFLYAAGQVLSQRSMSLGKNLTEVSGWYEVFVSPDAMYLALASFSQYIDYNVREETSSRATYVEEIYEVVFEAYKDRRFQKDDVSKICLGLIGASSVRAPSLRQTDLIIETLEESVRGYGGEVSFGAYYGLGLIGQALPRVLTKSTHEKMDIMTKVSRICCFLVEELLSCFEDCDVGAFSSYVEGLKKGEADMDVVNALLDINDSSVSLLMTKQIQARHLFMSCALCLPSLRIVNGHLLLGAFHLMEAFEYGTGKGLVLPILLEACSENNLIDRDEIELICRGYAELFGSRMDVDSVDMDSEGLDDIFYAVCATSNKPTPHVVRRLLVGNRELFDEDGRVLSLIACVAKICPLPCLGGGNITQPALLSHGIEQTEVLGVVEVVENALDDEDGYSKFANVATILFGMLASQRSPHLLNEKPETSPQELVAIAKIDMAAVPAPLEGTLLAGILDSIDFSLKGMALGAGAVDEKLSRLFRSLEPLSLPDAFAKSMLEPSLPMLPGSLRKSWVSLLVSQVCGRRRAVFEGREFVNVALRLCLADEAEFFGLLGRGDAAELFMANLDFVVKFPNFSFDKSLQNIWGHCVGGRSQGSVLIANFLQSMNQLLTRSTLAPKTVNGIHKILTGRCRRDLVAMPIDEILATNEGTSSVADAYVACLGTVSVETLDEYKLFTFEDGFKYSIAEQCFDLVTLLELLRADYFQGLARRESKELSRATTSLAKLLPKCASVKDVTDLRRLMIVYSLATMSSPEEQSKSGGPRRPDQFATLLEKLLLVPQAGAQRGIEWISIALAHWANWSGSDVDITASFLLSRDPRAGLWRLSDAVVLNAYVDAATSDLPAHLAAMCNDTKAAALVFNLLHRLYVSWSMATVPNTGVLDSLWRCLLVCRSGTHSEVAFVAVAANHFQFGSSTEDEKRR